MVVESGVIGWWWLSLVSLVVVESGVIGWWWLSLVSLVGGG